MKTLITMALATALTATAASAALPGLDRDNSGTISASEFLHVYGPDAGIEQFNAIDTNNDQVVDATEFAAQTNGGFFEDE